MYMKTRPTISIGFLMNFSLSESTETHEKESGSGLREEYALYMFYFIIIHLFFVWSIYVIVMSYNMLLSCPFCLLYLCEGPDVLMNTCINAHSMCMETGLVE